MATLRKRSWLLALFGAKPRVTGTPGIHEFTEAAFKESKGAPPKLRELYSRYKEQKAA